MTRKTKARIRAFLTGSIPHIYIWTSLYLFAGFAKEVANFHNFEFEAIQHAFELFTKV